MKKILLTLLVPISLQAQVGIGTANPTADLHIAGNTSTIRIEKLNSTNDPIHNNGIKPSPAYVNANGDITLNPSGSNGIGPGGIYSPINFLTTVPDFIPNGPLNRGVIINNDMNETVKTGFIIAVPFSSPQAGLIEAKYSITTLLSSSNLNSSLTYFNDISTRAVKYYFCIDLNNNGLDAVELSKQYGTNGQYYSSYTQGILGYSYTNGHGYTSIPPGTHSLHFFAQVTDDVSKFTSIGIGGQSDTLKIRIYN